MTINDRTRLSIGFGAQRYYIFSGLVFLQGKLLIKQGQVYKDKVGRGCKPLRFFIKHFVFLLLLHFLTLTTLVVE